MNKTFNVLHQTVIFLVFLPFALLAENHINLKIGEEVYIERCVLCHGKNGEGWDWKKKAAKPPVPVANLLKVLPNRTDEYLATVIKFGGNAVGLTDFMPALGFNLTDRDVNNLIAYLRALKPKTSIDGAFFKKQIPLYDNLVWLPKKSGSLLHHLHDLIVPAAFFRPIAVSFSENNNRQNRFFQPN
ncbi:MAG: cytochrome c, partial [SAR324 cluster bacterium]|nr:cytochrome c [SAR324 cluster bacterium]